MKLQARSLFALLVCALIPSAASAYAVVSLTPAAQRQWTVAESLSVEVLSLPKVVGELHSIAVAEDDQVFLVVRKGVQSSILSWTPGSDSATVPAPVVLAKFEGVLDLLASDDGLLVLTYERLVRLELTSEPAASVLWQATEDRAQGRMARAFDGRIAFRLGDASYAVKMPQREGVVTYELPGIGLDTQLVFDERAELFAVGADPSGENPLAGILHVFPGAPMLWPNGQLVLAREGVGPAITYAGSDWPEIYRGALLCLDSDRGKLKAVAKIPRGGSHTVLNAIDVLWRQDGTHLHLRQLAFDAEGESLYVLLAKGMGEADSAVQLLRISAIRDSIENKQQAQSTDGSDQGDLQKGDAWIQILDDPSLAQRMHASLLGASSGFEHLVALERALLGGMGFGSLPSDRARRHAIWTLYDCIVRARAARGDESPAGADEQRAMRLLRRTLDLSIPEVRLHALRALGRLPGAVTARDLNEVISGSTPAVARHAAELAGRLRLVECGQTLAATLHEEGDPALLASVRWALSRTQSYSAAAQRMHGIVDPERREQFWKLFRDYPSEHAIEVVTSVLSGFDVPYRVRVEAVDFLEPFARVGDSRAEIALQALERARSDRAPAVRERAQAVLDSLSETDQEPYALAPSEPHQAQAVVPPWSLRNGALNEDVLRASLRPPSDRADALTDTLYRSIEAQRSGLSFENPLDWDHPMRHLYQHGWAGGGVAVGDIDKDGLPELFLTSQTGSNRLFMNRGGMRFEDTTVAAGMNEATHWSAGAAFGDLNGDGSLDLVVCNYDAANEVWLGDGAGHFRECASELGLAYHGASVQAALADYDRDGDLDVFLLTNRIYPGGGTDAPVMQRGPRGREVLSAGQEDSFAIQHRLEPNGMASYVVKAGERDRLFRNDGDDGFHDVSEEAGIFGHHPGLAVLWFDFDHDGLPDLFIGNDFWDPDFLYRNLGNGRFEDVKYDRLPHTPWFTMGADASDVNGDGRIDFLAADMAPTTHFLSKLMMGEMGDSRWFLESARPRQYMRNALYLNTGEQPFEEAAFQAGLAQSDWSWSVLFGDLDMDGREDLFVTNGSANHSFDPDLNARMQRLASEQDERGLTDPAARYEEAWQLYRSEPPRAEANWAFRNAGGLNFERSANAWGLDQVGLSFGAALADLDRDGDLDAVVQNLGQPVSLLENQSQQTGRLLVSLQGKASPSDGIGAELKLATGSGAAQIRQLFTAKGYLSSAEPIAHFAGVPNLEAGQSSVLTVRWPSGRTTTVRDVAPDTWILVREAEEQTEPVEPAPVATVLRELPQAGGLSIGGRPELLFDDYASQPLLPARLSSAGPGLACADFDNDGDEDLFVGGAKGQSGLLFIRDGEAGSERTPRFRIATEGPDGSYPWREDRQCEDSAMLWFDANQDGMLDLFIASGSNEFEEGHLAYRNRLYIQHVPGHFTRVVDALPDLRESTQVACAADFDGDGDLDLFIGNRSIPGRYPVSPASRLLRNEFGVFRDVTESLAPGLLQAGLVTSALWSDVDDDGRMDLMLAREWGTIGLWMNTPAGMVEAQAVEGLAGRQGWWSSIEAGDFDADGRIDYAVGNAGTNNKYAGKTPLSLYYGSLEQGHAPNLIEAERGTLPGGEDCTWPTRGLSCSSHAMPSVRERMPSYRDFAAATLEQIYDPASLAESTRFQCTHLESGVLLNRSHAGAPSFEYRSLPSAAQRAPIQGLIAGDWTGDGELDLVLAQNFFGREPETGHWDGGVGLLLAGDGDGGFEALPAYASGMAVTGEGRALIRMDLDDFGMPEIVLSRQGEALHAWTSDHSEVLSVRLGAPEGRHTVIGAKVSLIEEGRPTRKRELRMGSGWMSQSSTTLYLPAPAGAARLIVRWPDGSLFERAVDRESKRVHITRYKRP